MEHKNVIRAVGTLLILNFILLIAMQIQLGRRNRQIDRIETATNELVEFTRDIQNNGNNDELEKVYAAVFNTLSLLCEEFPNNRVCLEG